MSGQHAAAATRHRGTPARPGATSRRAGAAAVALLAVSVVVLALLDRGASPGLATAVPADGALLAAPPPATVSLRFTQPLDPTRTHLSVADATGTVVDAGAVSVSGPTVVRPVAIAGGGVYRVAYHVGFETGPELSGVTTFIVSDHSAPRSQESRPAADPRAAANGPGGVAEAGHAHGRWDPLTGLVLIVDAAALVVIAGVVIFRRRSRRRR